MSTTESNAPHAAAQLESSAILVAVDLTPSSQGIINFAAEVARHLSSHLGIVTVTEFPGVPPESQFAHVLANQDQLAKDRDVLNKLAPSDPSLSYSHHHLIGQPAHELVEFARNNHAAMLVVGTHARTGLSRLLLGSVAEAVLRRATCPVLVYKPAAVDGYTAQAAAKA